MKRAVLKIFAKNNRKAQGGLLFVIGASVILYMTGALMSHNSNPRRTIIKKVKLHPDPLSEYSNDPVVYTHVKLTYFDPNPRYTITHFEQTEPKCFGEACELNRQRNEIQVMPVKRSQCIPISKCVTVNIKTRHRYLEVKEFIDSFHQFYPALKVVVLDEFNPGYEDTEWAKTVAESPLITYIQAKPGVGYGRKLAAMVSETPYVLVADDDYIFSKQTNITKLVEVLENSDADIVAGTTDDTFPFAGAVRVSSEEGKTLLSLYPGIYYGVVPNFRNCYQADIVKTFFLAKRESILRGGSWDVDRRFYEHEDFFFQMRKSRLKIAYCDDVIVKHVARTRDLAKLRNEYFDELKVRLLEKWKIDDYFSCTVPTTYTELETCELSKRKHFH